MNTLSIIWRGLAASLFLLAMNGTAAEFHLPARVRPETSKGSGEFLVVETNLIWDARKTAVVICDMWDRHWCDGAKLAGAFAGFGTDPRGQLKLGSRTRHRDEGKRGCQGQRFSPHPGPLPRGENSPNEFAR